MTWFARLLRMNIVIKIPPIFSPGFTPVARICSTTWTIFESPSSAKYSH